MLIDITTADKRAAYGNNSSIVTIGWGSDASWALAGNDTLIGPQDGVGMQARLLEGDDGIEIYSGWNWVNGNRGADQIYVMGGKGYALGGSGNDFIEVTGGEFERVNGNFGIDVITNHNGYFSELRGGAGNDILVNTGGGKGLFYGDSGADTFIPYAVDYLGRVLETYMWIVDFEPGVDVLDLSNIGGANFTYIGSDTLIGSNLTGALIAKVEGVHLY